MKNAFLIISLIGGFILWWFFSPEQDSNLRFFDTTSSESSLNDIINIAFGYTILLAGIVLGTWCRALIEKRDRGVNTINIRQFIKESFKSIDLWISVIASPIIYGSIVSNAGDINFGAFIYLALQTGFSSYIVVGTFLNKNPTQSPEG